MDEVVAAVLALNESEIALVADWLSERTIETGEQTPAAVAELAWKFWLASGRS